MSLIAFAAPIPPEKKEQWDRFIEELTGPRRADFVAASEGSGVRERTFFQQTPDGIQMVIVTLEGEHPETAKVRAANEDSDFARWFVRQVQEIHGFDVRQPPDNPPYLVVDTETTPAEKAFRRVIDEIINGRDLAAFDELFAPDFVEHELPPGVPPGREGTRQLFSALHAAFPDIHVDVKEIVARDDRAAAYMTWQGTQTGEFMGIPPTGKRATWEVFDMVRVVDGKLAEHWGLMDQLSLMQQLGVVPAPQETTV